MKVLLIGSGGREHAIAEMMRRSASEELKLYVAMDYLNPGLRKVAEASNGATFITETTNAGKILSLAEKISPDLIVVGPEEPQFAGVPDVLREEGYTVFGSDSKCSEIERSKVYARSIMWKHSIPGRLFFKAFKSVEEAREFMEFAGDVVLKPARQVGGKGVKVLKDSKAYLSDSVSEVKKSYVDILYKEMLGHDDVDYKVLVEQRVEGVEYTVQVITDGSTALPLPAIQDHPHAYEYDVGPETGGMGSVMGPGLTLPFLTYEEYRRSVDIVKKVVDALGREGCSSYRGVLAGQMMLTGVWGPTVIEFYSRFGDPEISNLVPALRSDFLNVLDKAAEGRLANVKLEIAEDLVTIVKAVAPVGYPNDKRLAAGHPIRIDEAAILNEGCIPLYASVELSSDGILYTRGSRAVEIVCSGSDYREAYLKSEKAVEHVKALDGWPLFHRSDIGSAELLNYRVKVAEKVRRVYTSRAKRGMLGKTLLWIPGEGVLSNPLISDVKVGRS